MKIIKICYLALIFIIATQVMSYANQTLNDEANELIYVLVKGKVISKKGDKQANNASALCLVKKPINIDGNMIQDSIVTFCYYKELQSNADPLFKRDSDTKPTPFIKQIVEWKYNKAQSKMKKAIITNISNWSKLERVSISINQKKLAEIAQNLLKFRAKDVAQVKINGKDSKIFTFDSHTSFESLEDFGKAANSIIVGQFSVEGRESIEKQQELLKFLKVDIKKQDAALEGSLHKLEKIREDIKTDKIKTEDIKKDIEAANKNYSDIKEKVDDIEALLRNKWIQIAALILIPLFSIIIFMFISNKKLKKHHLNYYKDQMNDTNSEMYKLYKRYIHKPFLDDLSSSDKLKKSIDKYAGNNPNQFLNNLLDLFEFLVKNFSSPEKKEKLNEKDRTKKRGGAIDKAQPESKLSLHKQQLPKKNDPTKIENNIKNVIAKIRKIETQCRKKEPHEDEPSPAEDNIINLVKTIDESFTNAKKILTKYTKDSDSFDLIIEELGNKLNVIIQCVGEDVDEEIKKQEAEEDKIQDNKDSYPIKLNTVSTKIKDLKTKITQIDTALKNCWAKNINSPKGSLEKIRDLNNNILRKIYPNTEELSDKLISEFQTISDELDAVKGQESEIEGLKSNLELFNDTKKLLNLILTYIRFPNLPEIIKQENINPLREQIQNEIDSKNPEPRHTKLYMATYSRNYYDGIIENLRDSKREDVVNALYLKTIFNKLGEFRPPNQLEPNNFIEDIGIFHKLFRAELFLNKFFINNKLFHDVRYLVGEKCSEFRGSIYNLGYEIDTIPLLEKPQQQLKDIQHSFTVDLQLKQIDEIQQEVLKLLKNQVSGFVVDIIQVQVRRNSLEKAIKPIQFHDVVLVSPGEWTESAEEIR
jgi:hypothetical protein